MYRQAIKVWQRGNNFQQIPVQVTNNRKYKITTDDSIESILKEKASTMQQGEMAKIGSHRNQAYVKKIVTLGPKKGTDRQAYSQTRSDVQSQYKQLHGKKALINNATELPSGHSHRQTLRAATKRIFNNSVKASTQ